MQVNITGIPAPQLTGLVASAGVSSVALKWDDPNSPYHKSTEVWASPNSDGSSATKLATVNDFTYVVVDAAPDKLMYYWVRSLSIFGRADGPISLIVNKAGNSVSGTTAKTLSLGASSQIFSVPKTGTVAPATVSLFASAQNLQGTISWSITAGTATLNDVAGSAYQKTLAYANMVSDTVTVQVTQDGLTDQMTIVKVRDGVDTITGMLTNEAANVSADFTGTVSSFAAAGGNFKVYEGTVDKSSSAAFSIVSATGVTLSMTAAGAYTVSAMSADTGSATLRATYKSVNIDKIYTITKAKAGTNGTNGSPGSPGSNGQRGTMDIAVSGYAGYSGVTDAQATTIFTNNAGYYPINMDRMTLYNGTTSATKFYNNGSWLVLSAYLNGNMLISGTLSASQITTGYLSADRLSGGTITGTSINIAGNFTVTASGTAQLYTANFSRCTASNGDAPGIAAFSATSSGSGPAFKFNGQISCVAQSSGASAAYNFFNHSVPVTDNVYYCGLYAYRWAGIVSATAVIVSSDARYKTQVEDSDLGLDFINALRPVSYVLLEGHKEITHGPEQFGPWPEGESAPEPEVEVVSVPGVRRHYGLIAQEVKAVLGNRDAAMWSLGDVNDPDSMQALRYEELIAPLIKAVQQLSAEVESLKSELAILKGS